MRNRKTKHDRNHIINKQPGRNKNMEQNERPSTVRELVLPGDLLSKDDRDLRAGHSTFKEDGNIYAAQLGIKSLRSNYLNVIPLKGAYIPRADDLIVGTVIGISPSTWLVDINSPYPAPLHVNEVPWRVDFGDTAQYLNIGDSILVNVFNVDEIMRIQVSMKNRQSRKLHGGHIVKITPSKVPRVIGKNGSMISMIKRETRCRMFVGQNGCIWLDGEPLDVLKAVQAVQLIEKNAHKMGLTDRVKAFLQEQDGGGKPDDEKPYTKNVGDTPVETPPGAVTGEPKVIPAEEPVVKPVEGQEVPGPVEEATIREENETPVEIAPDEIEEL
jgi:exosome complex component RRP4